MVKLLKIKRRDFFHGDSIPILVSRTVKTRSNNYHPTIKFTADISDKEVIFLDTCIYKGARFEKESILDTRTYFKPTETFQYTHFKSCHPPGVKKGFVKGEGLRLLRTNSSEETFVENIRIFKLRLRARGYPNNFIDKTLSEVKFSDRKKALQENTSVRKEILPFVTQYNPSVPNLKHVQKGEMASCRITT